MLDLAGQRVLVIGLGVSGRSAATFCADRGAQVLAVDERAGLDASGLRASVVVQLGGALPDPAAFDLVVPSPGVPYARYGARARRVWGDIELAYRALSVPVVAVTGTNGKSTCVRLIEAMLRAAGLRARAAGNVGEAALGLVGEPLDVAVLEVSSFQLEAVDAFRPKVAVLLNVTADHLDRHGSLDAYLDAKLRLFARQDASDFAVLNGDDPRVTGTAARLAANTLEFRLRGAVSRGACYDGEAIWLRTNGAPKRLSLAGLPPLVGPLRANVLASLLAVAAFGVDPEKALGALLSFRPLAHRCEVVAERGGVRWLDDSKATNPGAVAAALSTLDAPVIWIAGGRDKGLDFGELARAPLAKVRRALLIGEAAAQIADALGTRVAHEQVGTLEAAVARARALAAPGDVVLLSPACASFDQFQSYAQRGERFRALANAEEPR